MRPVDCCALRATSLEDRRFSEVESLLRPGDLLVFNDTKVINARLLGRKPSGGKVEALIERVLEPTLALAMVRTSHTPARGAQLIFEESVQATVEGRQDDFFVLRFDRDVRASWSNTAGCRCRRISIMRPIRLMPFAIRPFTRRTPVRLRRQLPAFTSLRIC